MESHSEKAQYSCLLIAFFRIIVPLVHIEPLYSYMLLLLCRDAGATEGWRRALVLLMTSY